MKVGISQPRYFPWMPYIARLNACDVWVFLDDVQFNRRSFEHRCMIGVPAETYLTVPVITSQRSNISDVLISEEEDWRSRHLNLIRDRYAGAPHLQDAVSFIEYCIYPGSDQLLLLLDRVTKECMKAFGITTKVEYQSRLGISSSSTQLLVDICRAVGATEYVSGQGGYRYMDMSLFREGLQVSFFDWPVTGESCLGEIARNGFGQGI